MDQRIGNYYPRKIHSDGLLKKPLLKISPLQNKLYQGNTNNFLLLRRMKIDTIKKKDLISHLIPTSFFFKYLRKPVTSLQLSFCQQRAVHRSGISLDIHTSSLSFIILSS